MAIKGAMATFSPKTYGRLLLFVAGLGGLLYGIDVGIISAALLYLGKTVDLTQGQTSAIVAAVLGGSMVSSLAAGFLADWIGRKTMMVVSGALFVASVVLIVISQGFTTLLLGRLLQGLSGGVIAVVVPLYLAECLSPQTRGRGSAIFQFMLTFGIVAAALVGLYYIHGAEAAIALAKGDLGLIRAAEDHAWRGMFLTVIYPGIAFMAGSLFLSETPRWLFKKGREEQALTALRRSLTPEEAQRELREMRAAGDAGRVASAASTGSLLQRRYILPFLLTCVILVCNQGTGINSVLAYLSVILQQAGMTAQHAAQGDLAVKTLNCVMTVVAIGLIDRKGRKLLLTLGTGGIILALLFDAAIFHHVEAKRIDVRAQVRSVLERRGGVIGPKDVRAMAPDATIPMALRAVYSRGDGERLVTIFSNGERRDEVKLQQNDGAVKGSAIQIERASLFPVPSERTGWWITLGLGVFIAFYSVGPGVVVWLTLSELMPTRIRSGGMGIALLLNQGASTAIAGMFLPVVSRFGYDAMFAAWAACTCLYFVTAAYFLPETKGKTLEEIELSFAAR